MFVFTHSAYRLTLAKQQLNFARASRFFVHFLAVVTRPRHDTSNFKSLLYMDPYKAGS